MPFTPEQINRFADIISEYVPLGIILDLPDPGFSLPLDDWRKLYVNKYSEFSKELVGAYHKRNVIPLLGHALFRRFHRDDLVATKFVEFCKDPDNIDIAYQAAFVLRANLLVGPELRQFLAEIEPRMCVVIADAGKKVGLRKGTGFLVGPDLIMTSRHTLRYHLHEDQRIEPAPGPCLAFFDHLYGDPIDRADPNDPGLRRVAFATEWLVKTSPEDKFDYVLVRLEEKIGLESYAGNGGRRRHWVTYNDTKIEPDERIIIPQHPGGANLKHDFGRYVETDQAGIRIRYTTETFPGSSGAPCFDGVHRLVAMHQGVYQPKQIAVYNQAVRFDRIASEIKPNLNTNFPKVEKPAELWSVTPSPQPARPILGRKTLIDWINYAESPTIKAGERILVVEAAAPHAGRGFTIEILRAARRESQDPVVVLGNERGADGKRQPLPQLADDALQLILQQLPFKVQTDNPFPPRPNIEAAGETKLEKWTSDDLLRALNEILAFHRQRSVDKRAVAAETALQMEALGKSARDKSKGKDELEAVEKHLAQVEKEILEIETVASKKAPQPRWERIWIAIIMTKDTHTSKELIELLAGLAKATNDELARLRFLFIGDVPQPLKSLSLNKPELLDPTSVTVKDYSRCVELIAKSLGIIDPPPGFMEGAEFAGTGPINLSRTRPDRLAFLQANLASMTADVKDLIRKASYD